MIETHDSKNALQIKAKPPNQIYADRPIIGQETNQINLQLND